MARNGTGTYNLLTNSWNPAVNGVTATAADWQSLINDVAAAITQSVSADGQTPMTGNLAMGNNKLTGIATGTANTDSASMANLNSVAGQAGAAGDRNLLINGNFIINQRVYVTGTATIGANQYTFDRWRIPTTGQSASFSAGTPDVSVTCPASGLEQVIEGAMIVGGVYTLSWSGTATAKVNGVAITNGGNTSSLTASTNVTIQFASGTVTRAQFEIGTSATPYQRRPLATEIALCQRYYETGASGIGGHASSPGFGTYYRHAFKVAKRAVPTLTYTTGSAANVSVFDARNPSGDSLQWYCTPTAAGGYGWDGTWTASAEL